MKATLVAGLRLFRKWHKYTGIVLAVFIFISAFTGLLLAWKKEWSLIQPPTTKGQSSELKDWLPLHQLDSIAKIALLQKLPDQPIFATKRIDVRPEKGIVKFIFGSKNMEVQIDGFTGDVYSVARRHSDWIEQLHDGSIISDNFKLLSMTLLSFGLFLLIGSGIWLWRGPIIIRKNRKNSPN